MARGGKRRAAGSRRAQAASSNRSGSEEATPAWKRHGPTVRAWILFLVTYAVLSELTVVNGGWLRDAAVTATAYLTAGALTLVGTAGRVDGDLVTSSIFSAKIVLECTAMVPILMLVAAVMAYPSGWRAKLLGIALGVPAIVLVNLFRLVSLFFIGHWYPEIFETAHLLVWQALMIFVTVLLWLVWATTFVNRRDVRPA